MADNIQILISALLEKTTPQELEKQLKNIQDKLPKLKLEADLDAQAQIKLHKSLQKIYKEEELQRLKQEQLSQKAMQATEKQLQYEQKVRLALAKQKQKELETELKLNSQREQAELKYWAQRRKESVESMTSKSSELQQMKEYYTQLEKTSKQELDAKIKTSNALAQQKQKELETNKIIQQRIEIFQKELNLRSKLLTDKYGSLVDTNKLQELTTDASKLTTESFSPESKARINATFKEIEVGAKTSSKAVKVATQDARSWGDELIRSAKKFGEWMLIGTAIMQSIRAIKEGIKTVVDLDKSLTELSKVSDLTANQLKSITSEAYRAGTSIGRTGKEVIDATSEFKRAGYEINDAFDLSQQALLLTNIGDGMDDVKESSSSLIAILKGFKMEAEDTAHIVDALNQVSNNFAVDTNNLTEILKRVSGTIGQTGTSYEELIGLATGGFESLRNAEMVASGINMISQRLRGMSEDGEEVTDLIPKIQEAFNKYTNNSVSVIDKQNGGLNSTYEILQQLSKVYPTLSDEAKAYLNEAIAGNRKQKGDYVQKCA